MPKTIDHSEPLYCSFSSKILSTNTCIGYIVYSMKELQTIGQEFYKGFIVKIYYSDEILFNESNDKNLFQVLYIDEGSVLVGNEVKEKALFTPLLLCLNYEPQQKNTLQMQRFSILSPMQ